VPAFEVPFTDGSTGVPLHQIVLPMPIEPERPGRHLPQTVPVRLVCDERSLVRPVSGFRCPLRVLAAWAEDASSAQLASLRWIWSQGSDSNVLGALALAIGTQGVLPFLPESVRFWGTDLLAPLGFRVEPELPETALRRAVGADTDELVVWDHDGFERIAREIFQPLCRGGVRLASESAATHQAEGRRP
jgi:hypothetical protein